MTSKGADGGGGGPQQGSPGTSLEVPAMDEMTSLAVKSKSDKVAQLCPTLCDPMDYTVHGILQARILEWVAVPFSRRSSQPGDQTQVSCLLLQADSLPTEAQWKHELSMGSM